MSKQALRNPVLFSLPLVFQVVLASSTTVACGVFGANSDGDAPAAAATTPPPADAVAVPVAQPPADPSAAPPLAGTPVSDEITEAFGVFVSTNGSTGADGSRVHPIASIEEAIKRAAQDHKRVYVCAGTYKEKIGITRGIGMVGGFDCTTDPAVWKKASTTTNNRSRIDSPTSPALTATDVDAATRFEGFDVYAPDATTPGASSIGFVAKNSPGLTIASSSINAGRGADGVAGALGAQLTLAASGVAGEKSNPGIPVPPNAFITPLPGGAAGVGACVGSTTIRGGNGGAGGAAGSFLCDKSWNPAAHRFDDAWIINSVAPSAGASGQGASATPGQDGPSATAIGAITADGYTASDGASGTDGTAGAGGAGGDAAHGAPDACVDANQGAKSTGSSGPGGGAGGCPGLAGTHGTGGGASVGAIITNSKGLIFSGTIVNASLGGAGGRGTFGSNPTLGGAAGVKLDVASAAQPGQAGGRSGVSGSGAGGPSFAIASQAGAPQMLDGSAVKPGKGGAGVPAETVTDAVGNVKTRPASADGASADHHEF